MFSKLKKLLFIDPDLAQKELESLEGKKFIVKGDSLQNENQEIICRIDHCRRGNKEHNAICLIRDIHNVINPADQKTKIQVEKSIVINCVD